MADDWMESLFGGVSEGGLIRDTKENQERGSAAEEFATATLLQVAKEFADEDMKEKEAKAKKEKLRQKLIDTMGPGVISPPGGGLIRIQRNLVKDLADKELPGRLDRLGVWAQVVKEVLDTDKLTALMASNRDVDEAVGKKAQYRVAYIKPKK